MPAVRRLQQRTSKPIRYVLSDNGPQFMKDVDTVLQHRRITHWWIYPRSPEMNAHCERFNRTIRESFVNYHQELLFCDRDAFNHKLADWPCSITPNDLILLWR